MLKIKLIPVGKTNQHTFRIVVAEAKSKRDGKYVEKIGHYNPLVDPAILEIDDKRLKYWQENGAKMTKAVKELTTKK